MTKVSEYKVLDTHVLAVVTVGPVHDWAAYIGAVDGEDHDLEAEEVAANGSKLSKRLAEFLFPEFKEWDYRD